MVEPNTVDDQRQLNAFVPDGKVFVGIGFDSYDAVWEIKEGPGGVRKAS